MSTKQTNPTALPAVEAEMKRRIAEAWKPMSPSHKGSLRLLEDIFRVSAGLPTVSDDETYAVDKDSE